MSRDALRPAAEAMVAAHRLYRTHRPPTADPGARFDQALELLTSALTADLADVDGTLRFIGRTIRAYRRSDAFARDRDPDVGRHSDARKQMTAAVVWLAVKAGLDASDI